MLIVLLAALITVGLIPPPLSPAADSGGGQLLGPQTLTNFNNRPTFFNRRPHRAYPLGHGPSVAHRIKRPNRHSWFAIPLHHRPVHPPICGPSLFASLSPQQSPHGGHGKAWRWFTTRKRSPNETSTLLTGLQRTVGWNDVDPPRRTSIPRHKGLSTKTGVYSPTPPPHLPNASTSPIEHFEQIASRTTRRQLGSSLGPSRRTFGLFCGTHQKPPDQVTM